MIGIGPYSMLPIEYFLMLDEMPLRVIDHDPKTIDQPAKYMFPNIFNGNTVLITTHTKIAVRADPSSKHAACEVVFFR